MCRRPPSDFNGLRDNPVAAGCREKPLQVSGQGQASRLRVLRRCVRVSSARWVRPAPPLRGRMGEGSACRHEDDLLVGRRVRARTGQLPRRGQAAKGSRGDERSDRGGCKSLRPLGHSRQRRGMGRQWLGGLQAARAPIGRRRVEGGRFLDGHRLRWILARPSNAPAMFGEDGVARG